MSLNRQQHAVVDWVQGGTGSANVVARAGTGKTFLLVGGVIRAIVEGDLGEVAIMAYNKAAADEFKTRISGLARELEDSRFSDWRRVQAGTVHSFGFSAVRRWAKNVRVDGDKVVGILRSRVDDLQRGSRGGDAALLAANVGPVAQLVSLAKQAGFGALVGLEDRRAWYDLALHHAVDEQAEGASVDQLIDWATPTLRTSFDQDRQVVDFDDMVLAPLVHNLRIWPKDWVLIDEAQDTNASRRALALKMLKPVTGRLVAVGDDRQAIYGFTGADADSLGLIARELGSITLPLSVTYRCPKAVVAEANRLVPDLEAHESAPAGLVRTIPDQIQEAVVISAPTWEEPGQTVPGHTRLVPWYKSERAGQGDAVLCRNVKPLVELAYEMLGEGVPCQVEGREIGEGMIRLATRWKRVQTLTQLEEKLAEFSEREVQKWQSKGREDRAQGIEDKVGALVSIGRALARDGSTLVEDLVLWIRELFAGGDASAVTLTTIHKSKGREWPRVFILYRSETLPSKWARKAWQQGQESNLEYVAITRAERELVYVERAA